MTTVYEEALVAETDRKPLISWAAVFAGLVFVVAGAWLLFLLGSAIGVSVADASDAEAMGKGLGIGATLWMLLSSFLVFFLGSLLTARLSGRSEHAIGMLHGVTLWSVGTVLMLVLGTWGIRGLIHTGTAAVTTAVSAGASITATGAQAQDDAAGLANSPLATSIQARIKREIADALATAPRDGPAQRLEPGRPIDRQQPGVTGQRPEASRAPTASQQEIRRALDQIDAETLIAAGQQIIAGEPDRARDVLAVHTTLSESEIDAIVRNVSQEMNQQIGDARQQLEQTAEAVSSYAQAVAWIAFVAGALGLIVAIGGGWLGAGTVRRLYAIDVSRTTST